MSDIELKLNFIKRILTDTLEDDVYDNFFSNGYPTESVMIGSLSHSIDPKREEGLDWPKRAHTMIGLKRLNNLHDSLDYIRKNNIEGDLVETGVWRGGATIFMKAYVEFYGLNKKVIVCDSFEGLPFPDTVKYPQDDGDKHHTFDFLKISLEDVKNNFKIYNLLDENVVFVKGWFSESLRDSNAFDRISLLRFDGDMYGSTIDVLSSLYDKVTSKGVIVIDDFCLPNCAKAVHDFRTDRKIIEDLKYIDKCGRFWIKN